MSRRFVLNQTLTLDYAQQLLNENLGYTQAKFEIDESKVQLIFLKQVLAGIVLEEDQKVYLENQFKFQGLDWSSVSPYLS